MSSEIERTKYNPTMSVSPPFYIDLSGSLRSMKIPPAASAYSSPRKSKGCGRMCCKGGIGKTAAEYSEASSVHGVAYVFDKGHGTLPRIAWLLIVLSGLTLGIYWSVEAYIDWQENPVLTSVKSTGKPISAIEYPAITICSQGTIDEVYENVMKHQLSEYAKSKNLDYGSLNDNQRAALKEAMISEQYPGLSRDPKFLYNSMSGKSSPENLAESTVLVSGGYDPCQYKDCASYTTACESGWVNNKVNHACTRQVEQGPYALDCGPQSVVPSFFLTSEFLSLNSDYFGDGSNYAPGNVIGSGDWFWVNTTLESDGTFSVIDSQGKTVALQDVIHANNHLLSKEPDFGNGDCMKMRFDHEIGRFFIQRALCSSSAKLLCAKEGNAAPPPLPGGRRKRNAQNADTDHSVESLDLVFDPSKDYETARRQAKKAYEAVDMVKSYPSLFEMLWYTQLPCFDVSNVTSSYNHEFGLLKWCSWKGARLNCSSIFSMFPTDRGMCCSFNMERAETMFRESQYRERIDSLTRRDKDLTFDSSAVPGWFEPIPESGQHRGLTLMLDAHNDKVASSTVPDDFEGFTAVIDSRKHFPLTSRKSFLIRPGHMNVVSLGATKVSADPEIRSSDPVKRSCYFDDEYALEAHEKYSQVACMLECSISRTLLSLTPREKCLPWYYPAVDADARMCNPFEARNFSKIMKKMDTEQCKHCLPDCDETLYSASVSASPFRSCDSKNVGLADLCDLGGGSGSDFSDMDPPKWGAAVLRQYEAANTTGDGSTPSYVGKTVKSSERSFIDGNKLNSDMFSASYDRGNLKYDSYKKDIAMVTFYFESNTVFEYSREEDARMTKIGYISQVGGLMGLCLGFSLLSFIELIYWFTYRLGRNM